MPAGLILLPDLLPIGRYHLTLHPMDYPLSLSCLLSPPTGVPHRILRVIGRMVSLGTSRLRYESHQVEDSCISDAYAKCELVSRDWLRLNFSAYLVGMRPRLHLVI